MEKIKQERGAGSRRQVAIINRVIRKDSPKMTFVQRSEGREEVSHLGTWGKHSRQKEKQW